MVRDAKHFAEEANSICDIQGIFITIPYHFMVQNDSMHKCYLNLSLSPATKSGESVLCIYIFFVITPLKISFLGIGVLVMPDV